MCPINFPKELYNPFEMRKKKIDNPLKFQNEFESFKKRLGKHTAWFLALHPNIQWDLLFLWKKYKWKSRVSGKDYSLRHFLYEKRQKGKFFVSKQKLRESTINQLIK